MGGEDGGTKSRGTGLHPSGLRFASAIILRSLDLEDHPRPETYTSEGFGSEGGNYRKVTLRKSD
jgi:hypothetical protein